MTAFLLGFDGLSPEYFTRHDYLFNEHELSGILRSARPFISPPAWTSLLTGVLPEVHGVTGMYPPVWVQDWKVRPFWFNHNVTVALYGVPHIKPIPRHWRVREFVGGFWWEDDEEYTKPATLKHRLAPRGYRIDCNYLKDEARILAGCPCDGCSHARCWDCDQERAYRERMEAVFHTSEMAHRIIRDAEMRRLLEPVDADIVIVAYSFPDRACHSSTSEDVRRAIYDQARAEVKYWLEDRGYKDVPWVVFSDHGEAVFESDHSPHCFNGVWASNMWDLCGCSIADIMPTIFGER